ncbi:hypothetical protein G9A89_017317 [Geosiphon pyriformis]|nr:hypothetical protein G9A89_017317 [Geosiphon pyriformis]
MAQNNSPISSTSDSITELEPLSSLQSKTEVPSPETNDPAPTLPDGPKIPVPSIFAFRTVLRGFYESISTNTSTSENMKPKTDEICIQWVKQKDVRRREGKEPDCRMLCLKRKKVKEKDKEEKSDQYKEPIRSNDSHKGNSKQPLISKGIDSELNSGKKVNLPQVRSRWNFLDGYYLSYVKGAEACKEYMGEMKQDNTETFEESPKSWNQKTKEYEIDLGEKFERTAAETTRVITRAFSPGFELVKRYFESWTDGTQASFFHRFYESAQRLDAIHLVQDNLKKKVEEWIKGGGGGDGNNGFNPGGAENNNTNESRGDSSDNSDNKTK